MYEKFSEQQKEVLHFLKLLDDNNVLSHVILAGSWAEYVYAQAGVLPGFELTLRTIDVDFLIKNLRRPAEVVSLPAIVKGEGYLIEHDTLMGTTKIFSPGGLEIEFLIPQKGSGVNPVLKTNLGVQAQALRHMGGVIDNAITVDLLGMNVTVPCPESYVLHKMLINDVRQPPKKEKDRVSIARLLPHINLEKASELFSQFSKKEKARIRTFVENHTAEICQDFSVDMRIKFTKFISANFPEITKSCGEVAERGAREVR